MRKIFVDTSFFIALLNPREQNNGPAQQAQSLASECLLITTGLVFVELLNFFSKYTSTTDLRSKAAEFVVKLNKDSNIQVKHVSVEDFDAALEKYKRFQDKRWSLVDCHSFIIMEKEQIHEALTFDQHFIQAGFSSLP
jgi:uncharacterized protein